MIFSEEILGRLPGSIVRTNDGRKFRVTRLYKKDDECASFCTGGGVIVYARTDGKETDYNSEIAEVVEWGPEAKPDQPDAINPSHYKQDGKRECWEMQVELVGREGYIAHCKATALKYLYRSGKKDAEPQELRKAAWYLQKAAELLEKNDD